MSERKQVKKGYSARTRGRDVSHWQARHTHVSYRNRIISYHRIATLHLLPVSEWGPRSSSEHIKTTEPTGVQNARVPACAGVPCVRARRQFHSKDVCVCIVRSVSCRSGILRPASPDDGAFLDIRPKGRLVVVHALIIIAPLIITRASSSGRCAARTTGRRALRRVVDLSTALAFRLAQIQPYAEVR